MVMFAIAVAVGAIIGFFGMDHMSTAFPDMGLFWQYVVLALLLFASIWLQALLHELGHLVAGLISGYRFSSFRIASLMIVFDGERIKLKLHKLAGTGGQCLMAPPEPDDEGRIPVVLYNLGGVIINIITVPVFVLLSQASASLPLLSEIFFMLACAGALTALTNGIPLRLQLVNNDGRNLLDLVDNAEAVRSFYGQLKITELMSGGARLRDMPSELFFVPSDESMSNAMAASAAVFYENRLMDRGDIDAAAELIDDLLSRETAIVGLHRGLLKCDRLTVALLRGESVGRTHELYNDAELSTMLKQMKTSLSVKRTEYAYAKLFSHDEESAAKIMADIKKCAAVSPYSSDVEAEMDIIKMIDEASH